ncbi:MAG: DNA polymerase IV 1 [Gammaproteobacteria bacterium]|nr:DNA polymerase IV 1 [Gammaproteobacteria bacterium]
MHNRDHTVTTERAIVHVDMDAFYASVEQRDEPAYHGRPVIVGGLGRRGVVAASSYEARRFGVRSAMPMGRARRLCPEAVYLKPRMEHYREVSAGLFAVFREITPLVEGISVDEAWLDVTDSRALFGDVETIGAWLKQTIRERTRLTASIGMASNKFLAKLASDYDKPDGFCRIATNRVRAFLAPLPVERLWGIGPRAAQRVRAKGITTIGELGGADEATLDRLLGNSAPHFRALAHGIDERAVISGRPEKSVSHEQTFDEDLYSLTVMRRKLLSLAEGVGIRLRRKYLRGATVTVKIRTGTWRTYTRSRTLAQPAASTRDIHRNALVLLEQWRGEHPREGVRLLGVGISGLAHIVQSTLFEPENGGVDITLDDIRARFGGDAIVRGSLVKRDKKPR